MMALCSWVRQYVGVLCRVICQGVLAFFVQCRLEFR